MAETAERPDGEPSVPAKMRPKYDAVVALTDAFSKEHLNEEYATLSREMAAVLARKRPSPLASGTPAAWADGIVRALGYVNFLGDKSLKPYMKTADVDAGFGVSTATGAARSKTIRDMLKLYPLDPKWTLPSRIADNPMAWMVMVNGFIADVRQMPRDVQEEAFEKGLIPYIPDDRRNEADEDERPGGAPGAA